MRKKIALAIAFLSMAIVLPGSIHAQEHRMNQGAFQPKVARQFLEEARKNTSWKTAFFTGENAQIVLMNISPQTNPDNEIGEEVHPFDQVILIVEGKGRLHLNGKTSLVSSDDLILIPEGIVHNLVNLDEVKPLKIVSFYSKNDMPKDRVYKKQAEEPKY